MNIKYIKATRDAGNLMRVTAYVDAEPEFIGELCAKVNESKDAYELKISKIHKARSRDANAYAWTLIDKIAEVTGDNPVNVYREAIRDIGGVSTMVCVKDEAVESLIEAWTTRGMGWQAETMPSKILDCTNVKLWYGSSVYDSAQMHRLIERLIEDAKAQGIETLTPDELARLKYE